MGGGNLGGVDRGYHEGEADAEAGGAPSGEEDGVCRRVTHEDGAEHEDEGG